MFNKFCDEKISIRNYEFVVEKKHLKKSISDVFFF